MDTPHSGGHSAGSRLLVTDSLMSEKTEIRPAAFVFLPSYIRNSWQLEPFFFLLETNILDVLDRQNTVLQTDNVSDLVQKFSGQ